MSYERVEVTTVKGSRVFTGARAVRDAAAWVVDMGAAFGPSIEAVEATTGVCLGPVSVDLDEDASVSAWADAIDAALRAEDTQRVPR